ncbi:MAG TPA: Mur ligase domain-containing protein, partial [Gaiellaceae bacterium]|nr:Mur ligase domain-containing protein [Gaiellaceae bacterium]
MIPIAVEELRALGLGKVQGSGELSGLEIDSRRVGVGDLFVAIRGGRAFVEDARDQGAATLVPHDEYAAMAIIG